MKEVKFTPQYRIALGSSVTETEVTQLINLLRLLGVPVYEETAEFDPEYPTLVWDESHVTQSKLSPEEYCGPSRGGGVIVETASEFVSHFLEDKSIVEVRLNSKYSAKINVKEQRVEVGCQSIDFDRVEELYNKIFKHKK